MIAAKLEAFFRTEEVRQFKRGLILLFSRLISIVQNFVEQNAELQKGVEFARDTVKTIHQNVKDSFETHAIKHIEQRLASTRLELQTAKKGYSEEMSKSQKVRFAIALLVIFISLLSNNYQLWPLSVANRSLRRTDKTEIC